MARYAADGTLDGSFGVAGIAWIAIPTTLVSGPGANDQPRTVMVLPSGKLLVAGVTKYNTSTGRMLIARFLANGTLDFCFGDGGFYVQDTWDVFSQGDTATDLLLQPDGKVLVVGTVNPSAWGYKALLRFMP